MGRQLERFPPANMRMCTLPQTTKPSSPLLHLHWLLRTQAPVSPAVDIVAHHLHPLAPVALNLSNVLSAPSLMYSVPLAFWLSPNSTSFTVTAPRNHYNLRLFYIRYANSGPEEDFFIKTDKRGPVVIIRLKREDLSPYGPECTQMPKLLCIHRADFKYHLPITYIWLPNVSIEQRRSINLCHLPTLTF